MTPATFNLSLRNSVPPRAVSPSLTAMWWAKKGDWEKAHRLVMDESGSDAAWVHAYLHRAENDLDNARYWYRSARKLEAKGTLDEEWAAIVGALLRD